MSAITIRAIEPSDHDEWIKLYTGYINHCRKGFDTERVETLWQWLMTERIIGLVAFVNGQMVGLAHAKEQLSPLNAKIVGYLDDLFVTPEYRGKDVATHLMLHLKELATAKDWLFIRWITRENNYRAKAFYDKISRKTHWHTYQIDI